MPSRASTSRCSAPAATPPRPSPPRPPRAARRSSTTRRAWRMDPAVPLVVSQVNPDDLAWHEGIIANPNCSTMQLVPVAHGAARRGRPRAGHRRHLPGGQRHGRQGHQGAPGARSRRTSPAEPLEAAVYPHQIAFNALPQVDVFLDNGYTKEEWKVVTESRKILHLPDLRISSTAVRVPVFVAHSEAVHVETRDPITPDRARTLFAAVPGVVVQDDPVDLDLPARHRGRRLRRDLRRAGPPGRVHRRTARPRVLGRQRQPAQGRGHQRRPARRDPRRARLGQGRRRTERGRNPGVTDCRAPRGARGDRRRGSGLHALPPARDAHEGRPRRGRPGHRGHVRRRGPGHERGPRGPPVRRSRRRPAREACSATSAGAATTSSSPTSSSAGRPATATPSRTRSPHARRTCSASSRRSTRPSS